MLTTKHSLNIMLTITLLIFFSSSLFSSPRNILLKELTQQFPRISLQLKKITDLDANKPRKNIFILGSGMAGLTAAYELGKLGHNVKILEASNRVGGRVWTHFFKTTGQYSELGAMRIPASHDYTRYYINVTELQDSLRPFISAPQPNNFYYFRGETCQVKETNQKILPKYCLSALEKKLASDPNNGPQGLLALHMINALKSLNGKFPSSTLTEDDDWGGLFGESFLTDRAAELEGQSLGEFLDRRVSSKGAKELIGVTTGLETMWERGVSPFLQEIVVNTGDGLQEIAGGMSRLPHALANLIGKDAIQFNTEVTSIELLPNKVRLGIRSTNKLKWDSPPNDERPTTTDADYVICTIPFGVLRCMELKGLSHWKREAIRNLDYVSSTKVLLNCTERFWEQESPQGRILGGSSMTDQITRSTYYPSDHALIKLMPAKQPKKPQAFFTLSQPIPLLEAHHTKSFSNPGPGVLLAAYTWGRDARRLGGLTPKERTNVVLDVLEHFHPQIRKFIHPEDGSASMFWDSYRWSRGSFSLFRPNDIRDNYHAAIQPEGNLFFAGEHCSTYQGWIQGAIKSSYNAMEELVQH